MKGEMKRIDQPRRMMTMGLLGAAFVLGACANTAPPPPPAAPAFDFEAQAPIRLKVARIDVVDAYNPPLRAPHREHEFRVPPAQIARKWAEKRLVAAGGEGVLTFTIKNASVIETPLEAASESGFFRRLKDKPDRKLDSTLAVELSYEGPMRAATIQSQATGFVELNRHASLNTAEGQYFSMLALMAEKFDASLSKKVDENLADITIAN